MPCDVGSGVLAQLHDGAFAELLLDLLQGVFQLAIVQVRHGILLRGERYKYNPDVRESLRPCTVH